MSGIGEALRSERLRQGRTLADAAAETRVRESYLAALEEEDFDVLGGDVYSRGFIRLYGKYLSLDAEGLVRLFKAHHERPAEVTAIPGATIDEIMPPMRGLPRIAGTPPVYAGVGLVLLLVVLFLAFRGGGDEGNTTLDPDAPGPAPAEAAGAVADGAGSEPTTTASATEADPSLAPAPVVSTDAGGASEGGAGALTEVQVMVTAIAPVQLRVLRGQPPVAGATLEPGESRTLTDPDGRQVVFTVSDMADVEILLNGEILAAPALAGMAVEISCAVGDVGCDATPQ